MLSLGICFFFFYLFCKKNSVNETGYCVWSYEQIDDIVILINGLTAYYTRRPVNGPEMRRDN